MGKIKVESIEYNCDICKENIEIREGFLEYKPNNYVCIIICKECLNKICEKANNEDLLDEDLFA
jgi:hypothetical protein